MTPLDPSDPALREAVGRGLREWLRAQEEALRDQRSQELSGMLDRPPGCLHPLTVDLCRACHGAQHGSGPCDLRAPLRGDEVRYCLGCGQVWLRGDVLRRLRDEVRARWKLPPSPWTAEERSGDPT